MNLDSLESSIQKLLSELYPPFEATAPTLLSQLFQIIDSRYRGDALRCLLDFLVPAKHILDSVQQAACAQFSDALFLCEGWPLCLRDQVVVHFAPINPQLLQPGDFYLQVAPFCDQSARVLICNLLEEEGLGLKVVEETPVPETDYPCIFSCEWLKEINRGRHGTPLSQCLLTTEQGVVRRPWERVAVPDFVEVPQCPGSSMASVPPQCPPLQSSLPPPFSHSSATPSILSPQTKSAKHCDVTSVSSTSAHTSSYSVETRICPAKHGIAVSLCLVDTSAASSSRLVKVRETETEGPKPIGWVSPNTWDSRVTGSEADPVAKTTAASSTCTGVSTYICKGADRSLVNEDKIVHLKGTSQSTPSCQVAAEGEYIDIVQANMLFSKAQSLAEDQRRSCAQMEAQMQRYPQGQVQMQPRVLLESFRPSQRQPNTHIPPPEHSQPHIQLHTNPQTHNHCRPEANASLTPIVSRETGHSQHSQHSHTYLDPFDPSQCVRTVRFAEKPCTPCMKRRQGGPALRAQELRCRYRDSYQAAIQNPVTFGKDIRRGRMLSAVEEDGDSSLCDDRQRPLEPGTEDPWCNVQRMWHDAGNKTQSPLSVSGDICKESGEINTVPYWKLGESHNAPCTVYKDTNPLQYGHQCDQPARKITVPFNEPGYANCAKPVYEEKSGSGDPQQPHEAYIKHPGLQFSTNESSAIAYERLYTPPNCSGTSQTTSVAPQNRPESVSDGRCSSLSTAVVDTSEKCDVVIVEGQKVRRKEKKNSCAEVPQLHVVKCKNSTAFRLVSPMVSRRRTVVPEDAQSTSTNFHQNPSQTNAPTTDTHTVSQAATACPRPDHLPLGPPDPRAHPLFLGVATLTGGIDRTGRPVVELYGDHQGWRSTVTCQELCQMFLYFHLITRREIRESGMTLVFDARKINPPPQLYKALMTLQEQNPQVLNSLVLVVNKDKGLRAERCPGVQTITVSSMKALLKLVEASHLSSRLDGTLCHSHCDWMELHQKLFPFVSDLHEASSLLLSAIAQLEEPQRTDTVQSVQQCMVEQRTLMRDVLEDSRLVSLQRQGGAMLARLRRESDLKYPHCEDLSDAVDSVTSLYNHMEEQVHVLVQKSNVSLEHLEYLTQLREMEEHFTQMQQWYNVEGERHLLEAESVEDSGDRLEQILNSFTAFLIEANDRRNHAMSLVSEAERLQQSGSSYPETERFMTLVQTFTSGLDDFLCRAEVCGRELQIMVNVCDFCEQAVSLANECIDHLDQSPTNSPPKQQQSQDPEGGDTSLSPSDGPTSSGPNATQVPLLDISTLKNFQDKFLQFSPERFQEVKTQATALQSSRGMRVWNMAWLRCQEARQQLQERIQDGGDVHHPNPNTGSWCERQYVDVVSTNNQTLSSSGQSLVVQSTPGPRHPQWEGIVSGAVDLGKREPAMGSNGNKSTNIACCNIIIKPEDHSDTGTSQRSMVTPQSPNRSVGRTEREVRRRQTNRARRDRDAAALSQSHTVGCQWFPWSRGLKGRSMSEDSCSTGGVATAGTSTTPPEQRDRPPSACSHHGQPSCRILKEAQKFQISRHGSFCSEDSCMSERAAGGERSSCCKHSSLPIGKYEGTFSLTNPQEGATNALRLQRVLDELVVTEREYVRSLRYILTHYFPLLDRPDIPQDLRGKRGIIFGNLEKLFNFHSHYFLPELEACNREPAMVARCFLRHSESFGLYALYSKNKPQSDALILNRRHDIFKKKQQELGDMMDLSSYLLRPIQRISKYSLLLQDMLALAGSYMAKNLVQDSLLASQSVCGPGVFVPDLSSSERERERAEIQSAAELVRFQMRHGNDLLTMDAIRDCDVNLKEQGQLIRQDEFTVLFRKKKCLRRIFLFEDLILFSKTKKTDVGNDVYVYKQSFKTSDIGMTQNSAVGGLCFEIWFRRRKSEDTYTLKASSVEVKKAWTTDLERILWDQAAHSRELRNQERVFMGMGRKPFMDIQPSDSAICDRAVSCVLPGRIPVAYCSHRSLDYPRPHSIGSGSTASTTLSQSSSSSGRGSLPPAAYPVNQMQGVEPAPGLCASPEAVVDNELNNRHLRQHHRRNCEQWGSPRPLIDSTASSSECINFISVSDHDRLSAAGGDRVGDASSSFVSFGPKFRPPLSRTTSLSLRTDSSPAIGRKRLGFAPKPPHLAHAQSEEIIIPKSTEV